MYSLALFNHKGGVGKTTLTFNIGLALAEMGQRVLFIDADAQANLTAVALAPLRVEEAYAEGQAISNALGPLVEGSGDFASPTVLQIRDRAWILPGHIDLSSYEAICPTGWTEALAGQVRGLRVTTAPFRLAAAAAAGVGADLVIFDVGPNVGAMNRNILLGCDGFVVPLAPDLFSLNALKSVGQSIAQWVREWAKIALSASERTPPLGFEIPRGMPAPLGYVSQQFSTYRQAPAEAYGRWLDQIPEAYRTEVASRIAATGVSLPPGPDQIGELRNLASLVPMAQKSNAAVFELAGSEARGAQYTRARDTFEAFAAIGDQILHRLQSVTDPK